MTLALLTARLRAALSSERIVVVCSLALAGALFTAAFSPLVSLTAVAMVVAGAAWMVSISTYNIAVQLSSPCWVSGRTLAGFQATVAGGLALGSPLWGVLADSYGVAAALTMASVLVAATSLLGLILPVSDPVAVAAVPPPSTGPR